MSAVNFGLQRETKKFPTYCKKEQIWIFCSQNEFHSDSVESLRNCLLRLGIFFTKLFASFAREIASLKWFSFAHTTPDSDSSGTGCAPGCETADAGFAPKQSFSDRRAGFTLKSISEVNRKNKTPIIQLTQPSIATMIIASQPPVAARCECI